MSITIHRDGQNYGPYTVDNIRQLLASGVLVSTDLALIEGAAEWTTLNLIPEITSSSPVPPPPLKTPSTSVPAPANSKKNGSKAGITASKSCFVWFCIIFACFVGLPFVAVIVISILIALKPMVLAA